MDVLIILVFVSLILVAGSIVLFFFTMRQRDFEHAERLSLLPLLEPTANKDGALHAPEKAAGVRGPNESNRS